MLNDLSDIMKAEGAALLQPLNFGAYKGQRLSQVPDSYIDHLADLAKIDAKELYKKAKLTKINRPAYGGRIPLIDTLFEWQEDTARRFASANYMAIFAEMGTGKTLCALNYMRGRWLAGDKALIICPKSVFSSWANALKTFTKARYVIARGSAAQKLEALETDQHFYIINYESLLNQDIYNYIYKTGFQWIVLDESHKIKNPSAKRTKKIIKLGATAEMRICMTGTPVTNSEQDLYSQITFLDRGAAFGNSFYRFRSTYFIQSYYKWLIHPRIKDQLAGIAGRVSVNVKKDDVLDLPEKLFQEIYVELSSQEAETYKTLKKEMVLILQDEETPVQHKIVELMKLRQITGGAVKDTETGMAVELGTSKAAALVDIIEASKQPVVIVFNYQAEGQMIERVLDAAGISRAVLAGYVNDKQREIALDAFTTGGCRALLLSQSMGIGIDGLQNVSDTMIFYSCNYSIEQRLQTEDRLHRSGQARPVLYIDLMAYIDGKETIDHAIKEVLAGKLTNINQVYEVMKGVVE